MTTRREWEAMSEDERERDERLAIMTVDGGMSEDEARAVLEQRQGELFPGKDKR